MLNEHLEHFVSQKLLLDPDFSSANIDVLADDGFVKLVGKVGSFRRKLKATKIASTCEGVASVENSLEVAESHCPNDSKIANLVIAELESHPHANHRIVRVDVRDGCVTLAGYVSSRRAASVIENLSMGVKGVREVKNMLMVNPLKVLANTDSTNTVRAALSRIVGLPFSQIRVVVTDQSAQLTGAVPELWQKEVAESTVRKFGILTVSNQIEVGEPGLID